jgi:3-hydroxyacyl-[acyl-carrier-protein] dehydratase
VIGLRIHRTGHHFGGQRGYRRFSRALACKPFQAPLQKFSQRRALENEHVKFNLIDKIESLTDDRIVAVKYVSLAEEYLADHFPTFPVLPGVMMLEAVTQAAAWLLHRRNDFSRSMAVLKEARNVKYGRFVAPGNFLRVDVEVTKLTDAGAVFKAIGSVGQVLTGPGTTASDAQALSARVELAYFNLAEKQPELADIDARLRDHNRRRWEVLRQASVGL